MSPSIISESPWDDIIHPLRQVTIQIFGSAGNHGVDVVWNHNGLIVTGAHVANGTLMIRFQDGRICRTELLRRERDSDLAVLRPPVRGIESARLCNSGIVPAALPAGVIAADIRLAPGSSGGPRAIGRFLQRTRGTAEGMQ